jgi:hypothetical protein
MSGCTKGVNVMTELTAKKGMTRYKSGHSKNDFDFAFLNDINYDDKRKLVDVIEALFGKIKALEESIEKNYKTQNDKLFNVIEDSKQKDVYELNVNRYGHIVGYKKISRDLIYVGELPKDIDNGCYTVDMKLDEKKQEALNSLD